MASGAIAILHRVVLVGCVAVLFGCQATWHLNFVNDSDVPLVVAVESADMRESWASEPGQGLTLMSSASGEQGRVLLLEPGTCRIFDEIELPAASSTLFVGWDLDSGVPQFIVADGAPSRDRDPPDPKTCHDD